MKYMGSKARLVQDFLPHLTEHLSDSTVYVEPFLGGANSMSAIPETVVKLGFEINPYLCAMWNKLLSGWVPRDDYSKTDYLHAKLNPDKDPALTGWLGVNLSYSGKWFGGYAGVVKTRGGVRDYQAEAFNNTMLQVSKLNNLSVVCSNYSELSFESGGFLIYCDPPYSGTTGYQVGFDSDSFFNWCREQKSYGNEVFISEYAAPFKCVWEKTVNSSLSANGSGGSNKRSVERLFHV